MKSKNTTSIALYTAGTVVPMLGTITEVVDIPDNVQYIINNEFICESVVSCHLSEIK